jgi:hypothetical protein
MAVINAKVQWPMSQPLGTKVTAACRQKHAKAVALGKNVLEDFEKIDKAPQNVGKTGAAPKRGAKARSGKRGRAGAASPPKQTKTPTAPASWRLALPWVSPGAGRGVAGPTGRARCQMRG